MESKVIFTAPGRASASCAPETKRSAKAIVDASTDGVFEGYASLFHLRDLGNDIVMPGAFADSLRDRGSRGVKLLWQHDAAQPVGAWLSIAEDHRGLKVCGRLNLEVAKAREVLSLMREGAVDGLSIGFRTKRAERDAKSGVRRLYQLDLWEISLVTFPMLPQARVDAVKRGHLPLDGKWNGGLQTRIVRTLRRTQSLMR
ncbi:MAG: HK97 family phage prohead protease [Beijerinckiaceae bacterium]